MTTENASLDFSWRATLPRKKIVVIGTGGSISTVGRSPFDLVDYGEFGQLVSADALFAMVPELAALADLEFVENISVHSEAMTSLQWTALAKVVSQHAGRPDVDGVIIIHGTSTLEEAAWFLHLTMRPPVPVIMTGALRPANGLSSDAGINLASAVCAASHAPLTEFGVLVVLDGEIHCARDATKSSTYRLGAFTSGEIGPIGFIDSAGAVSLYRRPRPRPAEFEFDHPRPLPRTDVVFAYSGADGVGVDAVVAAGAAGIVVASMAPGVCSPLQLRALEAAQQNGVAVAFSSRAGQGRVLQSEFLRKRGFYAADNLTPQKTCILLALALRAGLEPERIQASFLP